MDAALISTWDNPARGREQEALGVFMDSMAFWEKQAAAGKCESQEVFLAQYGHGMSIVKGESTTLQEILESDEWREIGNRVMAYVDGWRIEMWAAGDEIDEIVGSYGELIADL